MPRKQPGSSRIELLQGTLDMLMLQTLAWGPRYGFGIAQMIRAGSRNALQVDTGSLYPALHRLRATGRDRGGLGRIREQPARAHLSADGCRSPPAVRRALEVAAAREMRSPARWRRPPRATHEHRALAATGTRAQRRRDRRGARLAFENGDRGASRARRITLECRSECAARVRKCGSRAGGRAR